MRRLFGKNKSKGGPVEFAEDEERPEAVRRGSSDKYASKKLKRPGAGIGGTLSRWRTRDRTLPEEELRIPTPMGHAQEDTYGSRTPSPQEDPVQVNGSLRVVNATEEEDEEPPRPVPSPQRRRSERRARSDRSDQDIDALKAEVSRYRTERDQARLQFRDADEKCKHLDGHYTKLLERERNELETLRAGGAGGDAFAAVSDKLTPQELIEGGPHSVAGMNHAVHEFVISVIAESIHEPVEFDEGNEELLQKSRERNNFVMLIARLPPEQRDERDVRNRLVDVMLHSYLNRWMYSLFFTSHVASTSLVSKSINEFYKIITEQESFRSTQKWRQMTARAIASSLPDDVLEKVVDDDAKEILKLIGLAYTRSPEQLQPIEELVTSGIHHLYEYAHKLSISMKVDVESVRLSVESVLDKKLDLRYSNPLWDGEFKDRDDDQVLGTYAYGMMSRDGDRRRMLMLKPVAITEAIIHEMNKLIPRQSQRRTEMPPEDHDEHHTESEEEEEEPEE